MSFSCPESRRAQLAGNLFRAPLPSNKHDNGDAPSTIDEIIGLKLGVSGFACFNNRVEIGRVWFYLNLISVASDGNLRGSRRQAVPCFGRVHF